MLSAAENYTQLKIYSSWNATAPGRDRVPDHGISGGHVAKATHGDLGSVRPSSNASCSAHGISGLGKEQGQRTRVNSMSRWPSPPHHSPALYHWLSISSDLWPHEGSPVTS